MEAVLAVFAAAAALPRGKAGSAGK